MQKLQWLLKPAAQWMQLKFFRKLVPVLSVSLQKFLMAAEIPEPVRELESLPAAMV